MVANPVRWTVQDLDLMPDNWGSKRYEIINGELLVTRAPHAQHQNAGGNLHFELTAWSRQTGLGKALEAPGVILTDEDAIIPDVIWVSQERWENGLDDAGHFTVAPEIIVEVLSAGETNELRDRKAKLKLYSLHGVAEYWIVNWRMQTVEVFRRQDAQLQQVATLLQEDVLTSPILPGFECAIAAIFQ
ncbi:MAG: Uma2 family endonuclease [Cyanobacteria bacterium J06614_10]